MPSQTLVFQLHLVILIKGNCLATQRIHNIWGYHQWYLKSFKKLFLLRFCESHIGSLHALETTVSSYIRKKTSIERVTYYRELRLLEFFPRKSSKYLQWLLQHLVLSSHERQSTKKTTTSILKQGKKRRRKFDINTALV